MFDEINVEGRLIEFEPPEEYRSHSLISAKLYYTLPRVLLDELNREVGRDSLCKDLVEMEYQLSVLCGDHTSLIGFWGGALIPYNLLRERAIEFKESVLEEAAKEWGKSLQEVKDEIGLGDNRLQWAVRVKRAYCGWLMTNSEFRREHDQVFEQWRSCLARYGIPRMGPALKDAASFPEGTEGEGELAEFTTAFEQFFIRWRLDGMPAPLIPEPLGMHVPVMDLRPVLGHMSNAGTVFYFPDIFPIPSRDELRDLMEDALRAGVQMDHLTEWTEIVRSDSRAKNQMTRYARLFELQHYVRVIYGRHADHLDRKKGALQQALASFLGVSDDSIERDLSFIASRLGPDWHLTSA